MNTSLDKLDINKYGIVSTLNCKGDLRRRLLDLGIVNRYKYKSNS
ncbi:MAG: ferrous iron transport protein A [Clostridia bacterium]|nr:ferrous iron transport protein A [Clostridia bacterium]